MDRGKLTLYKFAGQRKHWYSRTEVESLRAERGQAREEQAAARPSTTTAQTGPKTTRVSTRRKYKRGGRIGPGDLGESERYFGEWLTTRQVAFLLSVTERTVGLMRQHGRLLGEQRETLITRRRQWHYLKRDVDALQEDRKYFARRVCWENHCTPEARARKQAEAEVANLKACMKATQRHIESGASGCVRWLDAKW